MHPGGFDCMWGSTNQQTLLSYLLLASNLLLNYLPIFDWASIFQPPATSNLTWFNLLCTGNTCHNLSAQNDQCPTSLRIDSGTSILSRLSSMPGSAEWSECTDFLVYDVLPIGWFRWPCHAGFNHLCTTRVHAHILLAFNVRTQLNVGDCVYPAYIHHLLKQFWSSCIDQEMAHAHARRKDR